MNLEEWVIKHQTNRIIDVKNEFNDDELTLLNKLNILIKDELYTGNEFECLMGDIGAYNKEKDMSDLDLKYCKSLRKTGVSKKDYKLLVERIENIFRKYEKFFICN